MNDTQKRFLLFIFGCIVVRALLVVAAKEGDKTVRKVMGVAAILISIGFMYFFITRSRMNPRETFGERIWWNGLRPVHAVLYLIFGIRALQDDDQAWVVLLVDVIIGFLSYVFHIARNQEFLSNLVPTSNQDAPKSETNNLLWPSPSYTSTILMKGEGNKDLINQLVFKNLNN